MTVSYQEDLLKWVKGPEGTYLEGKKSEEDRRLWTKKQVELLSQEVRECTLPELEILCKKKGILIWSIKYYDPDFYKAVIRKSKMCAIQDIIDEVGTGEHIPHQLRTLVRQKNTEYGLDKHHGEITCDDIQDYDPDWFDTVFKQRFVTLSDIFEKEDTPLPRFKKVLDWEFTR